VPRTISMHPLPASLSLPPRDADALSCGTRRARAVTSTRLRQPWERKPRSGGGGRGGGGGAVRSVLAMRAHIGPVPAQRAVLRLREAICRRQSTRARPPAGIRRRQRAMTAGKTGSKSRSTQRRRAYLVADGRRHLHFPAERLGDVELDHLYTRPLVAGAAHGHSLTHQLLPPQRRHVLAATLHTLPLPPRARVAMRMPAPSGLAANHLAHSVPHPARRLVQVVFGLVPLVEQLPAHTRTALWQSRETRATMGGGGTGEGEGEAEQRGGAGATRRGTAARLARAPYFWSARSRAPAQRHAVAWASKTVRSVSAGGCPSFNMLKSSTK